MDVATARIYDPWRRWMAENTILGVGADQIEDTLVANGVAAEVVRRELEAMAADPYFQLAASLAGRLHKLESMLHVRASIEAADASAEVERQASLDAEAFFTRYYSVNRPVVLAGFVGAGARLRRWSPASLAAAVGPSPVEVMAGRDADPDYEVNCERHRATMPFGDFVGLVTRGDRSNDCYLTANNHFFAGDAGRALLPDLADVGPGYLDGSPGSEGAYLWFGSAGTVTPLHHDHVNVLFVQVYGRKHFTLVSPMQSHLLYNEVGVYSPVDPRDPDLERYPRYRWATPVACVLRPGDALFLPAGWWHQVEACDVSISVSFTNFCRPNRYDWDVRL